MQRKFILSLVDGLHYRYLVDTGIVAALLDGNISLLILTTPLLKQKLESSSLISRPGVSIALLDDVKLGRIHQIHLFLITNASRRLSETLNVKNELKKKTGKFSYVMARFARAISGTWFYRQLLKFTGASFSSRRYRDLLREYHPTLVVLSTPGQKLNDLPLLYEAGRQGIKTLSPVYSWDNLTAKGPFIFDVDELIVWNDIMKEEAIHYHHYKPENVVVAGVPVFDSYVKVLQESADHKLAFRKQFGFGLDKPMITITTIPTIYFGACHRELVIRIAEFIRKGLLPDSNILVRPHPLDETDYSNLNTHQGVAVDYYGSSPEQNVLSRWTPREDNTTHLARTMKYSDVVINIASTITIDAACFNTPVINVAYDMKKDSGEYMGSIARYYNYTHYKHVVNVGAAAMVKSDAELLKMLNLYLSNPRHHATEREKLVIQQTGTLDGQAYKRIANAILTA